MTTTGERVSPSWWQTAVIYQIYPRSFQDSDGDGVGDLRGIIERLPHLTELGVDALWLSPIFRSPMADFGYDISDYIDIDPLFGTLAGFDALLQMAHARGLKVILDLVPNHTSDQHPWFIESRSSRANAKRDWYIWRDPAPDGGPPNNWLSRFGGSAWAFDPGTGQYYYHAFLAEQPDLNWRNPQVRQAMADVLRFWMRRGIDGFRVDAAAVLAVDTRLRNDPPNPEFREGVTPPPERFERVYTDDRSVTLEYLAGLRQVIEEFPDRVLLGEVDTSGERIADFYGSERRRLHLPLNYLLLDTPWEARAIADTILDYLDALPSGAWPCWVIGSHDKPRIASRLGPARARVAAMLLLTLPGTPILYAGDEIGMGDVPVPSGQARDPFERLVPGYGLNRDPERAPMRWDASPNAGFTAGEPWLPIGDDIAACNLDVQRKDERSLLALYRRLIQLRRNEPALRAGSYEPVDGSGDILAYRRSLDGRRILVALNFADADGEVALPGAGQIRLSTQLDRQDERVDESVRLRAHEGMVLAIDG
jgi:alpha-glucosidase